MKGGINPYRYQPEYRDAYVWYEEGGDHFVFTVERVPVIVERIVVVEKVVEKPVLPPYPDDEPQQFHETTTGRMLIGTMAFTFTVMTILCFIKLMLS